MMSPTRSFRRWIVTGQALRTRAEVPQLARYEGLQSVTRVSQHFGHCPYAKPPCPLWMRKSRSRNQTAFRRGQASSLSISTRNELRLTGFVM